MLGLNYGWPIEKRLRQELSEEIGLTGAYRTRLAYVRQASYNKSMLKIKRIYDEPAASDGTRVLVDRLWPRGVSKQRAAVDVWLKDVAPSPELRKWFNHEPAKFDEFRVKYADELSRNSAVSTLKELINDNPKVTLLYAAKDSKINHAVVLQKFLEK